MVLSPSSVRSLVQPVPAARFAGLSGVGLSRPLELVDDGFRVETVSRDEPSTGRLAVWR